MKYFVKDFVFLFDAVVLSLQSSNSVSPKITIWRTYSFLNPYSKENRVEIFLCGLVYILQINNFITFSPPHPPKRLGLSLLWAVTKTWCIF